MSRAILDTHILLWLVENDAQLSANQLNLILDPKIEIFISDISLYEISIKLALGKLELQGSLTELFQRVFHQQQLAFKKLPLTERHFTTYVGFPFPANGHRDPFDRMLIAQTLAEQAMLISADDKFDAYPGLQLIR